MNTLLVVDVRPPQHLKTCRLLFKSVMYLLPRGVGGEGGGGEVETDR